MTILEIAKKIPAEYRKEILDLNLIANASATKIDPVMQQLAIIWKNYIQPGFDAGCNLCMDRCLKNFRAMQDDLIQLEKDSRLLDEA